ncbi:hypothetical protein V6N13_039794 [Hibiscus sabdariffa]|uniref:CTLH/CRA C-terminal to LisH motif domain-containing protein n=1 Tax=Hibiscus sabdariffa TaxID=183260 RepID=A0ABR2SUF2_9ROSI
MTCIALVSYLVHNCFKETAESFIACTGTKQPSDYLEDIEKRKRTFQLDALEGIELTEQLAANLPEKTKDLHLIFQAFILWSLYALGNEALEFVQMKLNLFGNWKEQKYVEKLQVVKTLPLLYDFMAMLVNEEPEKSPMFHLLSSKYQQHVAENLNGAILAIERLIKPTTAFRQCLNQEHAKDTMPGVGFSFEYLIVPSPN